MQDQSDIKYIETNDKVLIVDEYTGVIQKDMRYGDAYNLFLHLKMRKPIKIPNIVALYSNKMSFLTKYKKIYGLTGTVGDEKLKLILKILLVYQLLLFRHIGKRNLII